MSVKIISDRSAEWVAAGLSARLDLNLLMTFLDIVNAGSISQTAVRLHMPKATLSRKLRQLEQQIGAVLLKRGPHKLELTDIGQALYQHCERIASEAADASNVAAEMQSQLKGAMRISIPFGVGNTWMSQALARFALMYPDVKLTIHVTQNKKAVQGIHVQIKGPKINLRTGASNSKGVITQQLKMKKAGILIFSPIASKKCNTKRVGVTNVFTPPVTG